MRALLEAVPFPLAAPSANRSGFISPTTAQHVLASLDGRIDLVLDAGPTSQRGGIDHSRDRPRRDMEGVAARAGR